jgi:Na+-driven multidrug efflux pump
VRKVKGKRRNPPILRSHVIQTGVAYLRIVGPAYGFFGLGMALYFASQGATRLFWPLVTGFLRVIVAIGGGWLALYLTGSLNWLFAALAFGLIVYGIALTAAIRSGAWFGQERTITARG